MEPDRKTSPAFHYFLRQRENLRCSFRACAQCLPFATTIDYSTVKLLCKPGQTLFQATLITFIPPLLSTSPVTLSLSREGLRLLKSLFKILHITAEKLQVAPLRWAGGPCQCSCAGFFQESGALFLTQVARVESGPQKTAVFLLWGGYLHLSLLQKSAYRGGGKEGFRWWRERAPCLPCPAQRGSTGSSRPAFLCLSACVSRRRQTGTQTQGGGAFPPSFYSFCKRLSSFFFFFFCLISFLVACLLPTSSITAMGAASPVRFPSFTTRVYPPWRSS